MTVLYAISKILSLPGSVTRAFWEQVVCRMSSIPVEDNRYLRGNEMCGHVEHELASTARSAFALCYVPRFMNVLLAVFVGSFSAFRLFYLGEFIMPWSVADIAAIWFAFSLLTNGSPLTEDAMNMWQLLYSKESNILQKIFYTPGALVSVAWAWLDKYCIHFIIGIVIIVLLAV